MRDLTESYPEQTNALRAALERAVVDKLDRHGIYTGDDCVHEVSARSYDGFIAHTNGGFRVLVPCTLRDVESEGLTDFETETLQSYIDQSRIDAAQSVIDDDYELRELAEDSPKQADDFLWHYVESLEDNWRARYHNPDAPEFDGFPKAPEYCAEAEALRETIYETEDHWLTEGSTFFYEITVLFYERDHRRNNTGDDEVYVFAGINTDFEYGRERGLATAEARDFKLKRLTAARIDAIVDAFADKL